MNGAASGHYFENYVVMELLKTYAYGKTKDTLCYYRDFNAKEIDVFVELNGFIHPLEIKKSTTTDRKEIKKYELLDKASIPRGTAELCVCDNPVPIDEKTCLFPVT